MTGFAMEARDLAGGAITVELRAVNSRFLDLVFKMGERGNMKRALVGDDIGTLVGSGAR